MKGRATEVPALVVDYPQIVANALAALYQPTQLRGEDFFKAVARLFGLTGREARQLLEEHGYDPFVKVLKAFKSYPYTRSEAAGGPDDDP